MTKQKRTKYQIVGLISLTLIIAAASYGFAKADGTGTTGLLEVGYGVQSDFDVSRITYTLDETKPTNFLAVKFYLDQPAVDVQAGISVTKSGQVFWADECEFSGYGWVCSFDESLDVRMANWLHVQ
jgi:hypothetical protein